MEYHLDRRVVLSSEREHKSLYSWSIKEFDKSGRQIGRDQIPWDWSLSFNVIELNPSCRLKISTEGDSEHFSRTSKVEISQYLYGKLLPSKEMREAGLYSLFGTQRKLEQLGLFISKMADGEQERCHLLGSLSYTSEWDFEQSTEPDYVQVHVYLSSDKYDHVLNFLKSPMAADVTVRLKGVSGFYSDWSPSIRTDSIKILSNTKDQQLDNPENLAFDPPMLGHVQEFELFLKQDCALSINNQKPSEGIEDREMDIRQSPNSQDTLESDGAQFRETILNQVALLKKHLGRTQLVLWLVFVVLVLQLLKSK
jgi:hypothetical protein